MKKKYDPVAIESKWQQYWMDNKTFLSKEDPSKPKYYVLDMFPYPSGTGLHVGHLVGYTATDVVARYKRQKGFNVLHPMGWDSFGLSAEQYAVRTGQHPAVTTAHNINNFRRQLQRMGFSYDWDREVTTSDRSYYKWTQWIFTKLYERGLAYEAEVLVNYCPALGTVLANEEVENGKAKEGGYPVERRPLKQWVLKITAYADRLIEDLDLVDWPQSLKKLQINWIGKSQGVMLHFIENKTKQSITAYTTCPDTLAGVTFLILAPEHPLVNTIVSDEQRATVEAYQKKAAAESEIERLGVNKEKTGVFTGAYAEHPIHGAPVPIWIADYVIMGYGTGAVMGVPAHDERDFDFAKKFKLPISAVYDPDVKSHPELFAEGENLEKVRQEVLEGLRCWSGDGKVLSTPVHNQLGAAGLDVTAMKEFMTEWLEKHNKGERTVQYKLRDWLFSRQRYWGEPFPILHFPDGTKRVLGLDELPLEPPSINDYKPSGDGKSPLARVKEWVEVVDAKTGRSALRETNTMPQWAGSCWYYLRFCDPLNEKEAWSAQAEKYWMPVDLYVGGVEHAVLHLLYARFWHKVLFDCGLVKESEPFQTLRNQGLVVARAYQREGGSYVSPEEVEQRDGQYFHRTTGELLRSQMEKMSKSKLNGVSPDEIMEESGADALRLYSLFMGPLEKEKDWNTDAVSGCRRFLNRVYEIATSEKIVEEDTEEALKLGHRLVHGVGADVEALQFNTAIAKMMEFVNDFTKLSTYPKRVVKMLVHVLSAFAPHVAEELWQELGCQESLTHAPYPNVEAKYLEDAVVTYIVQVNGRLRGRLELPKDETEAVITDVAKRHPLVSKYLEGAEIEKVIFVPNRLLNLVIKN